MHRRRFLGATTVAALGSTVTRCASLRAAGSSAVRIGLVADPQHADLDPLNTRFYRQSITKLGEAVAHFNARELAFCVSLGDFIDKHWQSYDAIFQPLAESRYPFYHVLGNHDFDVADEYKARVPSRLGMQQRYYAIERGAWCFVMLDTTDISLYAHPDTAPQHAEAAAELQRLVSARAGNAKPWNGAVSDRQLQWFESTCQTAAKAERNVVVFAHHPVFPTNDHNEWNSARILEVVSRHRNVVAWLNGHNHAGAFGIHDDVPFITLKGMVETENTNAYSVAHFHADRLEILGCGREPSRELRFRKA